VIEIIVVAIAGVVFDVMVWYSNLDIERGLEESRLSHITVTAMG